MRRRQPFTTDRCKAYIMECERPLQLRTYKSVYVRPSVTPRPEESCKLPLRLIQIPNTDLHPALPITAARSAATKVFNIAELVEHILQYYEACDYQSHGHVATTSVMIKLQLINKTMRQVVMHSPHFSRFPFLKESPRTRRPWFVQTWNNTINPIISHAPSTLRDCFYPFTQVSWGMTAQQLRLQLRHEYTLERGFTVAAQTFRSISSKIAKHDQGTWRLMKLHYKQDMTVALTIRVSCRHCGYDSEEEIRLEKGIHQIVLHRDATLGDVVDHAREMITWIEAVALEGHDLENGGEEWYYASAGSDWLRY